MASAHPMAYPSLLLKTKKGAKNPKLTWGSRQALGEGACAGSSPKVISISSQYSISLIGKNFNCTDLIKFQARQYSMTRYNNDDVNGAE